MSQPGGLSVPAAPAALQGPRNDAWGQCTAAAWSAELCDTSSSVWIPQSQELGTAKKIICHSSGELQEPEQPGGAQ